jgi:hypothetical protein
MKDARVEWAEEGLDTQRQQDAHEASGSLSSSTCTETPDFRVPGAPHTSGVWCLFG